MPGCSRQTAHLPTLLPPAASPESPPGHSHHVSSSTSIALGPLLASCSVCDPDETASNRFIFLCWDKLIFVLLPSRQLWLFLDRIQIFTGRDQARRPRLRLGI